MCIRDSPCTSNIFLPNLNRLDIDQSDQSLVIASCMFPKSALHHNLRRRCSTSLGPARAGAVRPLRLREHDVDVSTIGRWDTLANSAPHGEIEGRAWLLSNFWGWVWTRKGRRGGHKGTACELQQFGGIVSVSYTHLQVPRFFANLKF